MGVPGLGLRSRGPSTGARPSSASVLQPGRDLLDLAQSSCCARRVPRGRGSPLGRRSPADEAHEAESGTAGRRRRQPAVASSAHARPRLHRRSRRCGSVEAAPGRRASNHFQVDVLLGDVVKERLGARRPPPPVASCAADEPGVIGAGTPCSRERTRQAGSGSAAPSSGGTGPALAASPPLRAGGPGRRSDRLPERGRGGGGPPSIPEGCPGWRGDAADGPASCWTALSLSGGWIVLLVRLGDVCGLPPRTKVRVGVVPLGCGALPPQMAGRQRRRP
jgi:hypothetical protein